MATKQRIKPGSTAVAVGAIAGLATAACAVVRRRKAQVGARGSADASGAEREWQCACGQAFRVAGVERHRVFWVAGAPEDDPVLGDRCPSCERPLPASA